MRASVQAAAAYRRKVLIDGVTSDEDKVAPVYRLEEICQVLKNSPLDVVREMLERILERLNHKSPIVKQKTLRLIKYAAGKGGTDFRREMQRQAGAVKALFNYKGQLDALKGDALNKAVRDTAHEAVSAIFGTEEKTTTMEDVGKRIQGFGSSNYESKPRVDDKKSVLSDLVGLGSQSLKQGIEMFQNYNQYTGSGSGGNRTSLTGTYRAQGLRRSLTAEREKAFDKEEGVAWNVKDAEAGDGRMNSFKADSSIISDRSSSKGIDSDERLNSTAEDRLLDSLTVPGGVRLQPSREALQNFTSAAQRLDASSLVQALEAKLQAHSWQVRFKTLCLIESLLKARDENLVLNTVAAMFEEDARSIVDSLQSPQTSLRDKAKKVLDLLGGNRQGTTGESGAPASQSPGIVNPTSSDLPDLLDTSDVDFSLAEDSVDRLGSLQNDLRSGNSVLASSADSSRVPDLLGNWSIESAHDSEMDPFAGMSLHSVDGEGEKGKEANLFTSGAGNNSVVGDNGAAVDSIRTNTRSFTGFATVPKDHASISGEGLVDLMGSLSITQGSSSSIDILNSNNLSLHNANANNMDAQLQSLSTVIPSKQQPKTVPDFNPAGGLLAPNMFQPSQHQGVGMSPGLPPNAGVGSHMFVYNPVRTQSCPGIHPGGSGNYSANVMQQPFAGGHMSFINAHAPFVQPQLGQSFSTFPNTSGPFQSSVLNGGGLTDGFDFSSDPKYTPAADSNKEDTRAFDFISDHISSQLGPKTSR